MFVLTCSKVGFQTMMTHGSDKKPGDPSPGRRGRRRGPDTILGSRGGVGSEGLKKKTLRKESALVVGWWLRGAEREQASQRQREVQTGSKRGIPS